MWPVASSAASQIVTFEEFEANFRSRELRRHGAKVKLPDQSFQVLVMLLERPGENWSRAKNSIHNCGPPILSLISTTA